MTIDNLRQEAKLKITERDSKTCVYVGSSQNDELIEKVRAELKDHVGDVVVLPSGTFGLNGIDPFLVVVKADMPRIVYGNLTDDSLLSIIRDCVIGDDIKADMAVGKIGGSKPSEIEDFFKLPFFKSQQRIALRNSGLINPEDINDYIVRGGYAELEKAISSQAIELIQAVESCEIKEIASSGQPVSSQWKHYHDVQGDKKYVVCNAVKRDVNDNSTRVLLESDPHTVLEGLMLAGYAVGACKGYVVVNQVNDLAIHRLKTAVRQLTEKGLLGDDVFGAGNHFDIEISICSDRVVNREDTAIISGLSGDKEMPFVRSEADEILRLQGIPICINSAEVLAKVPAILQNGGDWLKKIDTEQCIGTRIVNLHGDVMNSGVVEIPLDMPLQDIVNVISGGTTEGKGIKAVLVGGITGRFLKASDLDTGISFEDMNSDGIHNESGVIRVLTNEHCMVWETKEIMSYARQESCGKCVMCREGTYQIERILTDITEGESNAEDMILVEEICNGMKMVSICDYGNDAPNAVITALNSFREEFEAHVNKKICPALVCRKYITYHILGEKCTACGICAAQCPTDAILGEEDMIHIIDQHDCIKCGKCLEVCPQEYSAVVKAGLIKPRTPKELIPVGTWRRRR